MKRTIFLLLSLLLVCFFIGSLEGRVSDKEWRRMAQRFIEQYKATRAKSDANLRMKALEKLARADHPKMVKLLIRQVIPFELEKNDPIVLDLVIQLLRQLKDGEAVAELIRQAEKIRGPIKSILVRGLAGQIEEAEVVNLLIRLVSDKDTRVQIAAIDTLAYSCPKEALEPIIKALDSKNWKVRASAINYLAQVKDEESKEKAIETLRKQSAKESGRLKSDILRAIKRLKGLTNGSTDDQTIARFYGLSIESKNLVFVVDISGTMIYPANPPPVGGDDKYSPTPGDPEDEGQKMKKIEALRKELIGAIEKLPPDTLFSIISFHHQITVWEKKLVPAKQYRKKALEWIPKYVRTISDTEPDGATNIYDALERAFKFAQKTKKKGGVGGYLTTKGTLDSIFLMSDGLPNHGKYTKPSDILRAIKVLNQSLQIKIDTIAIGVGAGGADPDFMKRLADENHGRYIER